MSKTSRSDLFLFVLAMFIGLTLAAGISVWATTIGSNVDVTGTFTVNGNATFSDNSSDVNLFTGTLQASTTALFTGAVTTYGNATFGDAATDINLFTGTLQASTTALFTGAVTTYGNATFGDAAADVNLFTGTLQASTTALFTGAVTTYGNVTLGDAVGDVVTFTSGDLRYSNAGTTTIPDSSAVSWAYATSSSAGPAFVRFNTAAVFVGIATSAPAATLDIGGDGSLAVTAATGTATSTIRVQSRGAARGGCIELESVDGSATFRLYATSTTNTNQGGVGYAPAVFELGSCR